MMQLKVGYIGLGIMGKSMARNILKAGFELVVHNRSRESVKELVSEGAIEAHSPAEVASMVDVVFTNLPDSPDVELVALGENGIIEGAHNGLNLLIIQPSNPRPLVRLASAWPSMA
jgi:2-hydroxy-3-oxopropionate reductase